MAEEIVKKPDEPPIDVCIDGLCLQFRGWTEDLAASGLSALHVSTTIAWEHSMGYTGYSSALEAITQDTLKTRRHLAEAGDRMYAVDAVEDLARIGSDNSVGLILGLQDLTGLEYRPHLAEVLRELGIRVVQPGYNYANLFVDGCMEDRDAGLARAGRLMVQALNEVGITLDVSHLGTRSSLDIIEASSVPVAATHANRRAVFDNVRNHEDVVLREIAAAGGVIGIVTLGPLVWNGDPSPDGFPTMDTVVEHVLSMLELVGEDAVALGTDHIISPDLGTETSVGWTTLPPAARVTRKSPFLGYREAYVPPGSRVGPSTHWPRGFETIAGWAQLPQLLRDAGLADSTVAKVLGQNWLRLFRASWQPQ